MRDVCELPMTLQSMQRVVVVALQTVLHCSKYLCARGAGVTNYKVTCDKGIWYSAFV